MCGRFVSTLSTAALMEMFEATSDLEVEPSPRYNIAPTTTITVVTSTDGRRHLREMRWGLVPSWAEDLSIGQRMINARAETLSEKRSFRDLVPSRRCVIPMDGFYEWTPGRPDGPLGRGGRPLKQPYYIQRTDRRPVVVAGLWTRWSRGERPVETATIITCEANGDVDRLHHRMPAILDDEDLDLWLDDGVDDTTVLARLLGPAPRGTLDTHAVSTTVNSARTDGAELIIPLDDVVDE